MTQNTENALSKHKWMYYFCIYMGKALKEEKHATEIDLNFRNYINFLSEY